MFVSQCTSMIKRDQRFKIVVDYLVQHQDQFWIDVDEISRAQTTSLANKLAADLSCSVGQLEGKLEKAKESSEEVKLEIRLRAQRIVSNLQKRELTQTIEAVNGLLAESEQKFFILIDDLDEDWASDECQYPLIRGLLASLKTFKRIENLKIIVALREDLLEATLRDNPGRHFQPEKLDGMIARIRWSNELLSKLVELRIDRLFEHKYASKGIRIEDVLPAKVKGEPIRSFIVARTLRRPRDVIAFVNKILNIAGREIVLPVSAHDVYRAENAYSRDRLHALEKEWRSCHDLIDDYLAVAGAATELKSVRDLLGDKLDSLVLKSAELKGADDVITAAHGVYERDATDTDQVAVALAACLYKIGALGVKVHADEPYRYCFEDSASLDPRELNCTSKVKLHPMLKPVLRGHDNDDDVAA